MEKFKQSLFENFLFTDQYQLTMSQLYFRLDVHEKVVQFDHFFRDYPDYGKHQAGYCINAGLAWFIDWLMNLEVTEEALELLRSQKTDKGSPVFADDYLDWLKEAFSEKNLEIEAIPEGRVIHPNEPVTVVRGPIGLAQIIETALLNQLNYQILIATKASRIRLSGMQQMLLEFGARRAQDRGANAGVRAALIGGADFSSNVGISQVLGFPPKGTHSHSMVQFFMALGMSELEAFQAYADLYPDNCILLVDTVDTMESGIPNAIKVFEKLKKEGHQPLGIRLDSGDLAHLTIKAAKMLNDAGFEDVKIVLSNELDELTIWQIITQISHEGPEAGIEPDHLIQRLIYGVGTKLITSEGYPALGGVYKLTAVKDGEEWIPAIKISENMKKVPNPGNKSLWRIYDDRGYATADLLAEKGEAVENQQCLRLYHPVDRHKSRTLNAEDISKVEGLLVPVIKDGKVETNFPDIKELREHRDHDLERLDVGIKRLINPHIYHVSLSETIRNSKVKLIEKYGANSENSESRSFSG
jgi:nicotinate phosphoribosyltransferase